MSNLGPNFYPKLVQISSELGMKPEDLLAVMISESGLKPEAHEPTYNGGGLVGFMPSTLKGLNFKGSPEDFRKLSGEQQLDWVKKLVQGYASFNGGKPFSSGADYYIANFVPAALKLPGVQRKDNSYAFLEQNPQTVRDPKTGNLWSKKYYDVGIKFSPQMERLFYEKNPFFHKSTPGAITYGDMVEQVEQNKRNPIYAKAIADMKNTTGYEAPSAKPNSDSSSVSFLQSIENLFKKYIFASSDNAFLISVGSSSDKCSSLEYARILSAAIEDYFDVPTTIHSKDNDIEISCKIDGDKRVISEALKELSSSVSQAFKEATVKLGKVEPYNLVLTGVSSEHPILHPIQMDINYNKFKARFQ